MWLSVILYVTLRDVSVTCATYYCDSVTLRHCHRPRYSHVHGSHCIICRANCISCRYLRRYYEQSNSCALPVVAHHRILSCSLETWCAVFTKWCHFEFAAQQPRFCFVLIAATFHSHGHAGHSSRMLNFAKSPNNDFQISYKFCGRDTDSLAVSQQSTAVFFVQKLCEDN